MWAKNIVHMCMNVSAGEKVLFITDQPMAQMRERLMVVDGETLIEEGKYRV